jgi:hypothetical protein
MSAASWPPTTDSKTEKENPVALKDYAEYQTRKLFTQIYRQRVAYKEIISVA